MADDPRITRADAKGEKARLKALRPWYKKKRFILPLVLVGIIVIVALAGGGGDDGKEAVDTAADKVTGNGSDTSGESRRFPGRADAKKNDKERNLGESADLSGYTVAVKTAAFQQQLSQIERDGYLVADVTMLNRDDEAQSYNTFEWKLLTPGGQIIDPTFTSQEQLGSGDLVKGGSVSGKVIWKVGAQKGDYYVIYDPADLGDDRAVWKTTV